MVEVSGDRVTLGTDYGSCDGRDEVRLGASRVVDEETEPLLLTERKVVSRRDVVTVVILTAINLLNYTDRYIIAGYYYNYYHHNLILNYLFSVCGPLAPPFGIVLLTVTYSSARI